MTTTGLFVARRASRPGVSVVVPAFNEASHLPTLLATVTTALRELTERWELIVVDDGSRDATPQAVAPWLTRPGVRYVRLSRNFGKEAALSAGLDRADGDVVVLMDADGQHPVELLPQMLATWRAGADMVSAVRQSREEESLVKRLGTRLFYRLANAGSPVRIPPDAGDYRLMDRKVVDALRSLPERNRFMKGLYAWVGFDARMIPYTPRPRQAGRSSFSMRRLVRLALTGITAFSNMPLRVWSGTGAVIAFGALGYGAWVVVEHFQQGHPVPGYATMVASLMFFSGVQLLSIGILGEYVGRIFEEVKQRPVYLVGSESGRGALAPPDAAPAPEERLTRRLAPSVPPGPG
ncbi:glycosyltransferase family 2 protein [Aquabacterium sp.]|uniref:glycosyltransferase family 2 protein n=1 Tax=Aquabacterium sp. TaxID=1872578 RepID=UPI0037836981